MTWGQWADRRTLNIHRPIRTLQLGGERGSQEVGTGGIKCVTQRCRESFWSGVSQIELSALHPLLCVLANPRKGLLLSVLFNVINKFDLKLNPEPVFNSHQTVTLSLELFSWVSHSVTSQLEHHPYLIIRGAIKALCPPQPRCPVLLCSPDHERGSLRLDLGSRRWNSAWFWVEAGPADDLLHFSISKMLKATSAPQPLFLPALHLSSAHEKHQECKPPLIFKSDLQKDKFKHCRN